MQQTIFNILANKKNRRVKTIQASLNQGSETGIPWIFYHHTKEIL